MKSTLLRANQEDPDEEHGNDDVEEFVRDHIYTKYM